MQCIQKEFGVHLEQQIMFTDYFLQDCDRSRLYNTEVSPGWFCHRHILLLLLENVLHAVRH